MLYILKMEHSGNELGLHGMPVEPYECLPSRTIFFFFFVILQASVVLAK